MATIDVKDAGGSTVAVEKPLAPGRAAATASRPVVLSNEDAAFLDGIETALAALGTQTTLAAVLAKILTAPATEAKQDNAITQETALNTVLGVKGDAKSTATDTTAISVMQVAKQISASAQLSATAAKQPALGTAGSASTDVITVQGINSGTAQGISIASGGVASGALASGSVADGALVTFGAKADAKSTATDTTAITAMSVWKQISASVQAMVAGIVSLGASNMAGSMPVTIATDDARIGIVTETSPATDTASSGLNGRLQRIAQRLTTIIAGVSVSGDVASGATDSGNPVSIGGLAKTANPTAVADGQRVKQLFDKLGKSISVGAIRDLKGVTQTQISNSTSETTIVAAVASTFCDLYGIILANTGASTTKVTIKDATAGTTRTIIEVPTLETRGFMFAVDSAVPQATVNNNWTATCGTATTALEVTAFWVKNT